MAPTVRPIPPAAAALPASAPAPAPLKTRVLDALTADRVVPAISQLSRGVGTIFMMHRFRDEALGMPGHSPARLRENLETLRRHRFRLVPLAALLDMLEAGDPVPARTVAFTVDDGYADFARIAAPIFAEFDCPVTVFLTTGFIDDGLWGWWDQAFWAFAETPTRAASFAIGPNQVVLTYESRAERRLAADRVIDLLKTVGADERAAALVRMLAALELELPARPPERYAVMDWDDVRRASRSGVSFGPHTVTHPMLRQLDDASAMREIAGSWERLRAQLPEALPVFCYPFGETYAYSERDCALVRAAGLRAAITARQDYVGRAQYADPSALDRFALPRFPYPDGRAQCVKIASGIERAQLRLQRAMAR